MNIIVNESLFKFMTASLDKVLKVQLLFKNPLQIIVKLIHFQKEHSLKFFKVASDNWK